MRGNPDRTFRRSGKLVEHLDPAVFTVPRRRPAWRFLRRRWVEVVGFAGVLVAVFLFFAFNVPGV